MQFHFYNSGIPGEWQTLQTRSWGFTREEGDKCLCNYQNSLSYSKKAKAGRWRQVRTQLVLRSSSLRIVQPYRKNYSDYWKRPWDYAIWVQSCIYWVSEDFSHHSNGTYIFKNCIWYRIFLKTHNFKLYFFPFLDSGLCKYSNEKEKKIYQTSSLGQFFCWSPLNKAPLLKQSAILASRKG